MVGKMKNKAYKRTYMNIISRQHEQQKPTNEQANVLNEINALSNKKKIYKIKFTATVS